MNVRAQLKDGIYIHVRVRQFLLLVSKQTKLVQVWTTASVMSNVPAQFRRIALDIFTVHRIKYFLPTNNLHIWRCLQWNLSK